jgi:multimeric flavodoxin WrbA
MLTWPPGDAKKVLVLSTSPRTDGNSKHLAMAFAEGARGAGHVAAVVDTALHVHGMLRDCKTCRNAAGDCSIDDDFSRIFLDAYVHADAIAFATPLWWYGISGHMKTFLDRISCHISGSAAHGALNRARVMGKPTALLLSAEESNVASRLGVVIQMVEFCRHTRSDFCGVIVGVGNVRGEVARDPTGPVEEARRLGERILQIESTDYELDTERSPIVWRDGGDPLPSYWR